MVSIRNTELETDSKMVTNNVSAVTLGGQVASGMKRWVTFMTVDGPVKNVASGPKLYFASVGVSNPSKASLIATGNRKLLFDQRTSGCLAKANNMADGPPFMLPDKPNANAPLFSIAGGKWLGVWASYTTANVFIQYYDE